MGRTDRLLTGTARFAGDLDAPGLAHLVFVRAPLAHGRIAHIDTAEAVSLPGVLAVFTAADLDLEPIWEIHMIPELFAQPPLARDVVRYVGERVVAVVAESLASAVDAAAAVIVDYEPLAVVATPAAAVDAGATPLFPSHGTNVALEWSTPAGEPDVPGDPDDVVIASAVTMPRVAVAPMEGLAILAVPGDDGRLTLHASTQSPHSTQVQTARALRLPLERVRVVAPSVGGGFGGKSLGGVPDYAVTAAAALRLGRAVRFVEARTDNLTTMQGRGMHLRFTVRAGADGVIRHLAVDELCDAGAYASTNAVEPGKTMMMMAGPYRIDAIEFTARSAVTNTAPTGAYRGPGRSESALVLERALDLVARELHIDPVEVRRRNLLRTEDLPRESVMGAHYGAADHHGVLDELLARTDYQGLRAEQARRRAEDPARAFGIGVATIVDSSAWFSRAEPARVTVTPTGTVRVTTASASAGQDHAAVFRAIVAAVLPVAPEDVELVQGDTDELCGSGSSGSRTAQLAGSAVQQAAQVVLDQARRVAAQQIEAALDDIDVTAEGFGVRGVPARRLSLAAVAAAASPARLPELTEAGLDARCVFEQALPTYPSAAHLAAVEVDLDTGAVTVCRHVAVTDCGRVLDPPGAHGQVVGASAQGVAQVLYEQFAYDGDANPTTTNFAEYLVPAASEQPPFESYFRATAATVNPLGAKGIGEVGMVGAPAAVHSAVMDALFHLGVRHVDIPCTPERVWAAISATRDRW
jgi:carbon-monoxide dehydrogenase large subunit